jgi:hypothetical protein
MSPITASLDVLLTYLAEAVILLTLGIILGNILVETGIFGRLTRLTRPLGGISGLSEESTTATLGKNEKILYRADFLPTIMMTRKSTARMGAIEIPAFVVVGTGTVTTVVIIPPSGVCDGRIPRFITVLTVTSSVSPTTCPWLFSSSACITRKGVPSCSSGTVPFTWTLTATSWFVG